MRKGTLILIPFLISLLTSLCSAQFDEFIWAVEAGGPDPFSDRGEDIAIDTMGNVYFTRAFGNTAPFGDTNLISDIYNSRLTTIKIPVFNGD